MINVTDSHRPTTGVLPSSQSEADTLKISFLAKLDDLLLSPSDDVGFGYFRINLTEKAGSLSQIISHYAKKGIEFDQVFHDYDLGNDNAGTILVTEISRILQISCNLPDKTLIPKLFLRVTEQLDREQKSETLITMMHDLIALEKRYLETPRVQVEAQPTVSEDLHEEEQYIYMSSNLPAIQSYLLVSLGLVHTTLGIACGFEPGYLACVLGCHIPLLAAIVAASAGMAMIGYGLYLSVFLHPEVQAADDSLLQELDAEDSSPFDQLFGCYGAQ